MTAPRPDRRVRERRGPCGSTASRTPSRRSRAGRAVVVVDDEDRENEGDLIFAAEKATPELVAFMVRYTSGYLCVPLDGRDLRPARPAADVRGQPGQARHRVHGHRRRARRCRRPASRPPTAPRTMRLLADPATVADDFTRPGHVVPLRAKDGGVLRRPGHTEAAVDLARLAGLQPGRRDLRDRGQNDDGTMCARPTSCRAFADEHGLALISIADLIACRRRNEKHRSCASPTPGIPTAHGEFRAVGYRSIYDDVEHVALVRGDIGGRRRTTCWCGCTPSA